MCPFGSYPAGEKMKQAIEREVIPRKKNNLQVDLYLAMNSFWAPNFVPVLSSQLTEEEQYLPIKLMGDFLMTSTGFQLNMKYWDVQPLF